MAPRTPDSCSALRDKLRMSSPVHSQRGRPRLLLLSYERCAPGARDLLKPHVLFAVSHRLFSGPRLVLKLVGIRWPVVRINATEKDDVFRGVLQPHVLFQTPPPLSTSIRAYTASPRARAQKSPLRHSLCSNLGGKERDSLCSTLQPSPLRV